MRYPVDFTDETALHNLFVYQTRYMGAPRFGSVPICYYQMDQCQLHDAISRAVQAKLRRCAGSIRTRIAASPWVQAEIYAQPDKGAAWVLLGSPDTIAREYGEKT